MGIDSAVISLIFDTVHLHQARDHTDTRTVAAREIVIASVTGTCFNRISLPNTLEASWRDLDAPTNFRSHNVLYMMDPIVFLC